MSMSCKIESKVVLNALHTSNENEISQVKNWKIMNIPTNIPLFIMLPGSTLRLKHRPLVAEPGQLFQLERIVLVEC